MIVTCQRWKLSVSYLGDDERLPVLQAALQGEAPRRSSLQPGLQQQPAASSSTCGTPDPRTLAANAALHAGQGALSPGSSVLCPAAVLRTEKEKGGRPGLKKMTSPP